MARKKQDDDGDNHVLTEEEQAALFAQHRKAYERDLAAKKAADAALKNTCKKAKAEIGTNAVQMIKDAIDLETEKGEAKLKQRIADLERVSRWMAVPIFAQADMFANPDLTPAKERAFNEGRRDGKKGDPFENPYAKDNPLHHYYYQGWEAGQKDLFAIQKKRDEGFFDEDGADEDEGELGDEEAGEDDEHPDPDAENTLSAG